MCGPLITVRSSGVSAAKKKINVCLTGVDLERTISAEMMPFLFQICSKYSFSRNLIFFMLNAPDRTSSFTQWSDIHAFPRSLLPTPFPCFGVSFYQFGRHLFSIICTCATSFFHAAFAHTNGMVYSFKLTHISTNAPVPLCHGSPLPSQNHNTHCRIPVNIHLTLSIDLK